MTPEDKRKIDGMTYYQLLRKWRFAPAGDPFFQDLERTEYIRERMAHLREQDPEAAVSASKALRW